MVFLTRPDKGMALYGLIIAVILVYVQDTTAAAVNIADFIDNDEIPEKSHGKWTVVESLNLLAPTASGLLDGRRFVYGTPNGQRHVSEFEEVNTKLLALSNRIKALTGNLEPLQVGKDRLLGATLYGDDVRRLTFLLSYLCIHLRLDSQGELIPEGQAAAWAEAVLDMGSDGVEQVLNNLHNMVMGTSGFFGSQSIIKVYMADLVDKNSPTFWADVQSFTEYLLSLEVAGYASWATAFNMKESFHRVRSIIDSAEKNLKEQIDYILSDIMPPRDCEDLRARGEDASGVYTITVSQRTNPTNLDVFCDMETEGGGWTMLLRRQDGTVNFNVRWHAYKTGFGQTSSEFYLGNDNMNLLTTMNDRLYMVRFDLVSNAQGSRFAEYTSFLVGNEASKYVALLGAYSGTAGDSFSSNGIQFSTKDKDNDAFPGNCAEHFTGGWWFSSACHGNMLTGTYGQDVSYASGVTWQGFLGYYQFLDYADMKIKPYL